MSLYDNLAAKVDRILWEEWDPIGVNDCAEAWDEYSSYVPGVVRLVQNGANEAQIAHHLQTLEDLLGVGIYANRRRRVAGKIAELVYER